MAKSKFGAFNWHFLNFYQPL